MDLESKRELREMFFRLIERRSDTDPAERSRMRREVVLALAEESNLKDAIRRGLEIVKPSRMEDAENTADMLHQRTASGMALGSQLMIEVQARSRGPLEALVALTYAKERLLQLIRKDSEWGGGAFDRVTGTIDFILETVAAAAREEMGETEEQWTASLDRIAQSVKAKQASEAPT